MIQLLTLIAFAATAAINLTKPVNKSPKVLNSNENLIEIQINSIKKTSNTFDKSLNKSNS